MPIKATDGQLSELRRAGFSCAFIAVGTTRAGDLRSGIYERLLQEGYLLIRVVSSDAAVSEDACLGDGVFIGKRAVVNAGASVRTGAIVNTGAIVEHDCVVDAFAHIAPGSVLSGNVIAGRNSHVGAGAVIKQGVKLGNNVTIGAGSVVLSDIPDNAVAYGVPCKVVKFNDSGRIIQRSLNNKPCKCQ